MTPHTTLADSWRSRLAAAERQIALDPTYRRWLPGIYVRVYRYLLACYGDAPPIEVTVDRTADRMEFHDETRDVDGAAPKPVENIRATLSAIHEARGEGVPSGPLADGGLQENDWITVAAASSHVAPNGCVRLLRQRGLRARKIRQGDDTIIVVPVAQRERAFRLLHDNRDALRLARRRGRDAQTVCLAVLSLVLLCVPTIVVCSTLWVLFRVGWANFAFPVDQMLYAGAAAATVAGLCGLLLAFSWRQ